MGIVYGFALSNGVCVFVIISFEDQLSDIYPHEKFVAMKLKI